MTGKTLPEDLKIASLQIHADDQIGASLPDVSAPISVTTTFRYNSDPEKLVTAKETAEAIDAGTLDIHDIPDIYSRYTQPVSSRAEAVLSKILDGHAVLYSSGLSAFHAAMIYYNPKNVFIGDGYHGCHGILEILERNYNVKIHPLDADPSILQPGDVVHLETPVNPTGLAFDITHYAKLAHDRGAYLLIDATFAPPPLLDPFKYGVDMVMHSGTKYFGGHSDLLAGVLVTKDPKIEIKLKHDRNYIGTKISSLESWLLLRSLRTYNMRIKTQYENANKIVKYFSEHKDEFPVLKEILHASLQIAKYEQDKENNKDLAFVKEQLPLGGGPVFSIKVKDEEVAKRLPSKTNLFHHATSLGGVESLIEWRAMSDPTVERNLLRVSVGVEDVDDLIKDLSNAFKSS